MLSAALNVVANHSRFGCVVKAMSLAAVSFIVLQTCLAFRIKSHLNSHNAMILIILIMSMILKRNVDNILNNI